jgi:preprotein translocase subunit SecY
VNINELITYRPVVYLNTVLLLCFGTAICMYLCELSLNQRNTVPYN